MIENEKLQKYIFFVCEIIKHFIIIIIILFYSSGYFYTYNKYTNNTAAAPAAPAMNNDRNDKKVRASDIPIDWTNNGLNHSKIINDCVDTIFDEVYTPMFKNIPIIIIIFTFIVYGFSSIMIPNNYYDNINNIFIDLVLKFLTLIVFMPILLIILFYGLIIGLSLFKESSGLYLKPRSVFLFACFTYYIFLVGLLLVYSYRFFSKDIFGELKKKERKTSYSGIEDTMLVFFDYNNKKGLLGLSIANSIVIGIGSLLSFYTLLNNNGQSKLFLLICSIFNINEYRNYFNILIQFLCNEEKSKMIKNIGRILLGLIVVMLSFQLLPIALSIFSLCLLIFLIYRSFSSILKIDCTDPPGTISPPIPVAPPVAPAVSTQVKTAVA